MTTFTFKSAIPLFLIGMIYTGLLPLVFSWLRLAKREDVPYAQVVDLEAGEEYQMQPRLSETQDNV